MALLETQPRSLLFLCGRCGTAKREYQTAGEPDVYVPALVERCRRFTRELGGDAGLLSRWESFGIAESIETPEDRPRA